MPAILSLPDIRQNDNHSCGSVALKCVLSYWLERNVRTPVTACPLNGTHPSCFPVAFRRQGFKYVAGTMTLEDLQHHGAMGRPVVVLVQLDGVGHYVVVAGVSRGYVRYQCPVGGQKKQKTDAFLARWFDTDADGHPFPQWGIAAWV